MNDRITEILLTTGLFLVFFVTTTYVAIWIATVKFQRRHAIMKERLDRRYAEQVAMFRRGTIEGGDDER